MIVESKLHIHNATHQRTGRLYLNDLEVGTVVIRGHDGSWGFGEFKPAPQFSSFATLFGRWSLLMHAEDGRLSEAASEELRETERELDRIRAALLLETTREWHRLLQVNIDGPLIEWKE